MRRHPEPPPLAAALLLAPTRPPRPAGAGEIAVEGQAGYRELAVQEHRAGPSSTRRAGARSAARCATRSGAGAFVSAGFRTFSKDGERVFVASSTAPRPRSSASRWSLKIDSLPVHGRLPLPPPARLIVPYAAAGASLAKYQETSAVAGESFDENVSKTGFVGAFGVEVGRGGLPVRRGGGLCDGLGRDRQGRRVEGLRRGRHRRRLRGRQDRRRLRPQVGLPRLSVSPRRAAGPDRRRRGPSPSSPSPRGCRPFSRHFSRTLTKSPRKTFVPRKASICCPGLAAHGLQHRTRRDRSGSPSGSRARRGSRRGCARGPRPP